MRNVLLRDFTPLSARTDKGALWKNLFFTERLKRHAFAQDGGEIYFWRTRQQHKIDFIKIVNSQIAAFKCKADNRNNSTSLRAFKRTYPRIPVPVASPENNDQPDMPTADLATAFDPL